MVTKPGYTIIMLCSLLACGKTQENNTATEISTLPTVTDSAAILASTTSQADSTDKLIKPNSSTTILTHFVITPSQVGPIKIGMPIAQMKRVVPAAQVKEVSITKEGQGYKAYEIRDNPSDEIPVLLIEEICKPNCRVWRMHALSPIIKTKEGLGIGSTLGDVRRFYNITYLGAGETEIVAVAQKDKITFLLDVSTLPEKVIPKLDVTNTPDEVKIKGMFIL